MKNVANAIRKRIYANHRGWVFSPMKFMDIGGRVVVDKTLSRLAKKGVIRRIGRGMYDFPKQNEFIGVLSASPEKVAGVVASKTGNRIFPSGATAANMIGLSTQVPAQRIYLTNGKSKTVEFDNQVVRLKHAHVPLIDSLSKKANLVLQALYYLGKDSIDDIVVKQCADYLSAVDVKRLLKNATFLPAWLVDKIRLIQIYKQMGEEDGQNCKIGGQK